MVEEGAVVGGWVDVDERTVTVQKRWRKKMNVK